MRRRCARLTSRVAPVAPHPARPCRPRWRAEQQSRSLGCSRATRPRTRLPACSSWARLSHVTFPLSSSFCLSAAALSTSAPMPTPLGASSTSLGHTSSARDGPRSSLTRRGRSGPTRCAQSASVHWSSLPAPRPIDESAFDSFGAGLHPNDGSTTHDPYRLTCWWPATCVGIDEYTADSTHVRSHTKRARYVEGHWEREACELVLV
jgi:hypothetical protein